MKVRVTGSSGHLGEALMRVRPARGLAPVGLDIKPGPFTDIVGSVTDPATVAAAIDGAAGVMHAATLHKPHVATHARRDFVDVNVTGALTLLEAARTAGVKRFLFTSTTSAFGDALTPPPGAPAAWITEDVAGAPKNIYGATKTAAETLCELFARRFDLPCVVLRTARFFPEEDDRRAIREGYSDANAKLNEFLNRRVDVEDIVDAHLLALEKAPALGFDRFIISAPSPFTPDDLQLLRDDAPAALRRHVDFDAAYQALGFRMFPSFDRVYVSARAQAVLGWRPKYDFSAMLDRVGSGRPPMSDLAVAIGKKGYHDETFVDGPFPVDDDPRQGRIVG